MRRARVGAAAAPLFLAARRSGRRRKGRRGAGVRGGLERVGAAAVWDTGPRSRPLPRPEAYGGCARRYRGVGSCGGGVQPPPGCRTCGGARLAFLSGPDRKKKAAFLTQLCLGSGARGALRRRLPRPSFISLPHRLRQPEASSGVQKLGRWRSESFISLEG